MAQKKHKTKRRIICILCASIIALYALSIPIGAVVNGSQVSGDSAGLYGISPFPYTVGFVQNDPTLDRNYIFATDVGSYGLLDNTVVDGDDVFQWQYPDESSTNTSSIIYSDVEENWLNDELYWYALGSSGDYNGSDMNKFYGGFGGITLEYNNVTSGYNSTAESIVFKARNVYYNTVWALEQTAPNIFKKLNNPDAEGYMMPSFRLPVLDDYSTQAFVGAYSVEVLISDPNGNSTWHTYSVPIDTRVQVLDEIPFISYDVISSYINLGSWGQLLNADVPKTLLISEYRGFLDVDYYEYTEPVDDSIVGTWVFNDNLFAGSNYDASYAILSSVYKSNSDIYGELIYGSTSYKLVFSEEQYPNYYGIFVNASSIVMKYPARAITFSFSDLGGSSIEFYDNIVSDSNIIIGSNFLTWLQANASKQVSTATVAEGTWEKVADIPLLNKVSVTYPMYNTSNATHPYYDNFWERVFSYPSGKKFMEEVIGNAPTSPDIPVYDEIPEEMYDNYTGWLGQGVAGFFSAQIFPGITLGGIVGVMVMFGCAIALLKIFAGG